jgi:hypothetical protein
MRQPGRGGRCRLRSLGAWPGGRAGAGRSLPVRDEVIGTRVAREGVRPGPPDVCSWHRATRSARSSPCPSSTTASREAVAFSIFWRVPGEVQHRGRIASDHDEYDRGLRDRPPAVSGSVLPEPVFPCRARSGPPAGAEGPGQARHHAGRRLAPGAGLSPGARPCRRAFPDEDVAADRCER